MKKKKEEQEARIADIKSKILCSTWDPSSRSGYRAYDGHRQGLSYRAEDGHRQGLAIVLRWSSSRSSYRATVVIVKVWLLSYGGHRQSLAIVLRWSSSRSGYRATVVIVKVWL